MCGYFMGWPESSRQDTSECIRPDANIQTSCNSVAILGDASQHLQKHGPFCVCGGWDGGFGGRGKAHEFQRVGSLAPVGGDGFVVSFLDVFSLFAPSWE